MAPPLRRKPLPWRSITKIALLIVVIVVANLINARVLEGISVDIRPSNEPAIHRAIMTSAVLYAVLLAIPFVPGAEIGIALIVMFGPPIAILVYLCTLAGLCTAFVIGRLVPLTVLIRWAEDLRLARIARLLREIGEQDAAGRLGFLAGKAPNRLVPLLLRYRYLALALAINLPGNFLIGGGGGICLFSGLSRLYAPGWFLLTVALAVAPVPLAVLFFGADIIARQ